MKRLVAGVACLGVALVGLTGWQVAATRGDAAGASRPILPVPPDPVDIAVDGGADRAFVAGNLNDAGGVAMIDIGSGKLVRTISIPGGATAVAADLNTGRIFVGAGYTSRTITILDARSGRVVGHIAGGPIFGPIVVDADRRRFSFPTWGGIRIVDTTTARVLHTARLGPPTLSLDLGGVALDPGAGHLWATHSIGSGSTSTANGVAIIDEATGRVIRDVPTGPFPRQVAIDNRARRVFVADGAALRTFDARDGRLLRTVALLFQATSLVVDARSGRVFAADYGHGAVVTPRSGPAHIYVLDAATGRLPRVIDAPLQPQILAAAAEGVAVQIGGRVELLDGRGGYVRRTVGPIGPRDRWLGLPAVSALDARTGRLVVAFGSMEVHNRPMGPLDVARAIGARLFRVRVATQNMTPTIKEIGDARVLDLHR